MTNRDVHSGGYELIDFGDGRKLERFGTVVLDRPCSAAECERKASPSIWGRATARYERTSGEQGMWIPPQAPPNAWQASFSLAASDSPIALTFHLQPSLFGHIGVFPEQSASWEWILRRIETSAEPLAKRSRPLRVLNVFAYTGGSTLAAAAAGAEVVHIDAARNSVERARHNAQLSGLADRPIRWIVEDAIKFCRREIRREKRYEAIILDPPTYGHGPKGEPWKMDEHLPLLLTLCGELIAENPAFVLVTCHTPGIGPAELAAVLAEGVGGRCNTPPAAGELCLESRDGRRLPSGVFARWPA